MNKILPSLVIGIGSVLATQASYSSNVEKISSSYTRSDYAKTKYPIVFAHGFAGFNRLGTDQLGMDYWYQILPDLSKNGANVWASRVSPMNSSEIRGEQFLSQLEEVMAITGAEKVNLVGHSHGANTIRYAAGIMPEHVASILSVAGANKGTTFADDLLNVGEKTKTLSLIKGGFTLLSQTLVFAEGLNPKVFPHDPIAAANALTIVGADKFNKKFPLGMPKTACGDGPAIDGGIAFFSMIGNKSFTNPLDPVDYVFKATDVLSLSRMGANDGLVSVCSSKIGKTIRDDFAWNHIDEVNLILGLRGLFSPDPVDVYRQHANRLKGMGL